MALFMSGGTSVVMERSPILRKSCVFLGGLEVVQPHGWSSARTTPAPSGIYAVANEHRFSIKRQLHRRLDGLRCRDPIMPLCCLAHSALHIMSRHSRCTPRLLGKWRM